MKHVHRILILIPLFFISGTSLIINLKNADAGDKKNEIVFRWTFAAIKGPAEKCEIISITDGTSLETGDKMKFFIELQTRCFAYLIYRTSNNTLNMLFPYDGQQYQKEPATFRKYFIPDGEDWFVLDENTGEETFYLLVSDKRMMSLEKRYKQYRDAGVKHKDALADRFVREIETIKKARFVRETLGERPVSIAGELRDPCQHIRDISQIAEKFSADDFFSRTIAIEHK